MTDTPTPNPPVSPPVTPTPPAAAPMRGSLRWLLIGSLTVNFLVVGVVAGSALKWRDGGSPHAVELSLGPFARALEDDDRRAILRDLMRNDDARPPPRRERDATMTALVAALRADPFTLDPVRTLIQNQKDWVTSAQTAAQEAVLGRISAMTPAERASFADRLAHEIGRGPDGDGHDGD